MLVLIGHGTFDGIEYKFNLPGPDVSAAELATLLDRIPAKIEEGLAHSRVLVLCMSAHAFGSDWAQLEAGTFRFRDPLNKERRFIPLRLDAHRPLVLEQIGTLRSGREVTLAASRITTPNKGTMKK